MLTCSPYRWFAQFYIGAFIASGAFNVYIASWFADRGLDSVHIGILFSVSLWLRCLANLFILPRLHRVEQLIPSLRFFTLLGIIACVGFHYVPVNFHTYFILMILISFPFGLTTPISDILTVHYVRRDIVDYGQVRRWASISFILGVLIVGFLLDYVSLDYILYITVISLIFSLAVTFINASPAPRSDDVNASTARPKMWRLLADRNMVYFLILSSLLSSSHCVYNTFGVNYWSHAGYSKGVISLFWAIAVCSEICLFTFSKQLFRRWSCKQMFYLGAFFVIIRWTILGSTTQLGWILLAQSMHAISFATVFYSTIRYISNQDGYNIVPLQALYNALAIGASNAIVTYVAGVLLEHIGGDTFYVMASFGLFSFYFISKLKE